jgi:hypothetical protein
MDEQALEIVDPPDIEEEEETDLETCEHCGELVEETFPVSVWNSHRYRYDGIECVCQSCLDSHYTSCDNCSETVSISTITSVSDNYVCNTCLGSYTTCERCEELIRIDTSYSMDDATYCESCYQEQQSESTVVHDYSYSPQTRFFDVDGYETYSGVGLFHGIELECGWRSGDRVEYAEQVIAAFGEQVCYLKEDSSITDAQVDDGFEIVTQPCRLEWYRQNLPAICDGRIPGLLSHNAGEGLGLHISVNRNALTNHAIARICTFIGADRNEEWLVRMARRKADRWAQIVKKNKIEDTLESYADGGTYLKINESRYEAVNLINSSHIEFRLFRGTLKLSSAMLCLEFVNALCRWCMEPCEVSEYQSAAALLAFARQEPEVYPHLIDFLCSAI